MHFIGVIGIRAFRERTKMSQTELAETLQVSSAALHNWESGKRDPNTDVIRSLLQLGATTEELFGVPCPHVLQPAMAVSEPRAVTSLPEEALTRTEVQRMIEEALGKPAIPLEAKDLPTKAEAAAIDRLDEMIRQTGVFQELKAASRPIVAPSQKAG